MNVYKMCHVSLTVRPTPLFPDTPLTGMGWDGAFIVKEPAGRGRAAARCALRSRLHKQHQDSTLQRMEANGWKDST